MQDVFPILLAMLVRHEGRRLEAYRDHKGFLTIGVGHNIDADPNWPKGKTKISEDECDAILQKDSEIAVQDCFQLFSNYRVLPVGVKAALADMAFNLGRTKLAGFKRLRAAIEAGDFEGAALEIEDSNYFRDPQLQRQGRPQFIRDMVRFHAKI
ncbi:MAG: glycoside hydrolase family protein [Burkholderiaceae bacterium]